jgi:hypothetical protein
MPRQILAGPCAPATRLQGRTAASPPRGLIQLLSLGLLLAGAIPTGAQERSQLPAQPAVGQKPLEYEIQLTPPERAQVFRAESEAAALERIRREAAARREKAQFPREAPFTPSINMRNPWDYPTSVGVCAAPLVCYHPLYFEDKNTERYGWSLGAIQPLVSTAKFYFDLLTLPYNIGVMPPWRCECNAGYCLPGDPVPYRLYLPPWSWKGAALQTGAVLGTVLP